MLIGGLLLLSLYALPMWEITLGAPQYPDPLGMHIWINKITGMNPHDLKNINLMNHYIGMESIPETIPELRYFPYIIGFMFLMAVLFAILGNNKLYLFWFIIMIILGSLGMYDFWLWEHNYGHNLHSDAAIKFVDEIGNPMSYQPPLIGYKTILNFKVTSFPAVGAYLLFLGMISSLLAFYIGKKEKIISKTKKKIFNEHKKLKIATITLIALLLISCSVEEREINYGHDSCHYCKMLIVDKNHATEIVTKKGKVYTYDSLECMLNVIKESNHKKFKFFLTNVMNNPIELYNAEECSFLICKALASPMGGYLTAFESKDHAISMRNKIGGEIYSWDSLKTKFNVE